MGVTKKKSVPQRIPVKITKKYKKNPGGELTCKNFGVNGVQESTTLPKLPHPCLESGKERHININKFSGDCPGGGGSQPGGQVSPDRWPGLKSLCAVCGTQGT